MTQRNKLLHNRERDQIIDRYLQALDQGDIEGIETVLDQAAHDPSLDRMIHEVNAALYSEEGLDVFTASIETVRVLARQHLHSAFANETEMTADIERSLTVGEVVARLQADRQIAADDQEASRKLLNSRVELPEEISIRAISDLARRIGVAASERFWGTFREAAIMLGLGHSQAQARLAATREQQARHHPSVAQQADDGSREAAE